jgi:DNA invertase Pin-like site-specific DNA recombinase
MKRAPVPAFAYLRVSGKGQIDGDGFTRQLTAIRAYAKQHNLYIVEVFEEQGISGTKELEDRPALQSLLGALAGGTVKHVLVEKLDRLARDLMVQETIIGDFRKQGYELVSVCEPDLCSDDPSRKLIRQIFGAIAEYDRCMTVLKLRGARQRMKARTGRCEGIKPFGAFNGEADTLARMTALRSQGMSYGAIADMLTAEGHKARYADRWGGDSVNKILRAQSALSRNVVSNVAVADEVTA